MDKINYTQEIIAECRRILATGEDYENTCDKEPCFKCLAAFAKGRIDNRYSISMSPGDFIDGLMGIASMPTDYAMINAVKILESEYNKNHND